MAQSKIEWTEQMKARFWAKVEKSGECWIWKAGTFGGRYGQFRLGRRKVKAHRASYELCVGPVPEGGILCHRCDNPRCVNPDHLFVGDDQINAADRQSKGRSAFNLKSFSGEANSAARLDRATVETIRDIYRGGRVSYAELSKSFGISKSQVANIIKGRSWA